MSYTPCRNHANKNCFAGECPKGECDVDAAIKKGEMQAEIDKEKEYERMKQRTENWGNAQKKKPKRKYPTNYTPPKRKNRKKR